MASRAASSTRSGASGLLWVAPIGVVFVIFYAVPLVRMVLTSLDGTSLDLKHYAYLAHEDIYATVFLITVKIAVFVTAASLVIGYPIAYFLSQLRGTAMTIGLAFVLLPFWTSVLVRNYAWFVMLSRNGVINSSLIGLGLTAQPFALLFNTLAVTIGMTYVLVPFMILSLLSVMRGISSTYLRASASLGASRTETFWRVYFPLSKPGVYAGCLLVFITSIGFFITPALLGGGRVPMIAVLIESQVRGVLNFGVGSALGTLLLAIVLILYYIFDRVLGVETMFGNAR